MSLCNASSVAKQLSKLTDMAHHIELCECRQRYIEECAEQIIIKLAEYGINSNSKNPSTALEELLTDIHLKVRRIRVYAQETGGTLIAYSEARKHRRREKRQRYKKNRNKANYENMLEKFGNLSLSYDQKLLSAQPLPNYFSQNNNEQKFNF